MNLTDSPAEAAFRAELRDWLAEHDPGQEPADREQWFNWRRRWQATLASDNWCGVHWPQEYGGRDASVTQSAIFFEELATARAPLPANSLGLLLAGPTIMVWGTPEQKAQLLPPILSGEEIWCQGFSEPDAGSDLASLRTQAVKDGDGWLITGQKVWTSHAAHARRCALLARTSTESKRHDGLTFFLLDLDQPGVQVRPLREMTGDAHFNELFLDNARSSDGTVLGAVGEGWRVALTMLMAERSGLAFFWQVRLRQLLDQLIEQARERGLTDSDRIADRLGALEVRVECLRLLGYSGLSKLERNGEPGPEGSLAKLIWSRSNQELTQLAVDILGVDSLQAGTDWSYELLRARGNTIEGGTTEILKNVVAERVLRLPRAR